MKVLWTIAVILVIIDAVYLLSYMGRLMKLLEGIQKDTRELIVRARRAEEDDRDHADGEM